MEAGERCGYPSRVRSDQGGKNVHVHVHVHVARLMLMLRGLNRGSHITGRSVKALERCIHSVPFHVLSPFLLFGGQWHPQSR